MDFVRANETFGEIPTLLLVLTSRSVWCEAPDSFFFNLHSGGWNRGPLDTAAT
jgi:hypothetical protein